MVNQLEPYKEYKETGQIWVDKVPVHWKLTRNKNVMRLKKEIVGNESDKYTLLSLTLQGIIARDMKNPKGKFPKDFSTYQSVDYNDLVFCLFDIDETPRTVGLSPMHGMITGAYTTFSVVSNTNPKFLFYYYLSLDQNKSLKPLYTGLRKVIAPDTFLRTKMPVPPLEEQDQIVKYLDYQLFQINKFIRTKKKFIAVLKEQKQAVIDEAMTKGLNPEGEMKLSGIDWLGEIPEHWECNKIKRYAKISPSKSEKYKQYSLEEEVVFLPMEKISAHGEIDNSERRPIHEVKEGFTYFEKSDVVVAKITPCFENGKGACLDKLDTQIGFGTTELVVLRANQNMLPNYLYFITRTSYFRKLGAEVMTGAAGQKRVPTDFISNFSIGVPEIHEQAMILEYIKKQIEKIDSSITTTQKQIDLILEYRTRLITDVVTGNVDVRNIKVNLNQEGKLIKDNNIQGDIDEVLEGEECEV
jgi:type I restriction enzyme, S subunit